ncbi:MAG: molecular chaperone HtpG [Magnetococcales bacterium]|nr:molecular chaperone HtpG [Magnetococcales bacterium]
MSDVEHKETHAFQTEVTQLLHLMIHSLYSNKEIFLRELISNASDALDKLRFQAVSNAGLYENDSELKIRITFDRDAKTITIADNGIGMDKNEVIANIGTIARSGTREFLNSLTGDQAKDAHLIGQFGVGFYSSFIVAQSVSLTTRKAGLSREQGVRWQSSGDGQYTIEQVDQELRGTEIVLHLGEDQAEFLDDWRLRSIIRKFSDHVSWPILMIKPDYSKKDGDDKENIEVKAPEWETVNKASALWTRNKTDIKDEEYNEFYKHVGHDFEEPLAHLHVRLEGKQEYTLLLFVPKRAPFDLWDRDGKHGVKLYVRRVFIMEGAKELMPRYLRFIRGVIDSSDLPLNISREILQNNPMVDAIRKGTVGKIFGLFEEMAEKEPDKFKQVWKTFGMVLKEGIIEDYSNKNRLAKLLRFSSTHNDTSEQEVSLTDYVGRMKPDQEKIYYVTAESFAAAKNSPHLEIFRKKGIEVLLLSDRVDEWMVSHFTEFEGKPLQSVAKGGLDLGKLEDEEEKKDLEKKEGDFKELLDRVKKSLGETIKEARLTHRLTDSPACLVGDEHDISATMARILKDAGQDVPGTMRILELNPGHPLVIRLKNESNDERFNDLSRILYDQAMLSEGGQLDDPPGFIKKLNKLLMEMAS